MGPLGTLNTPNIAGTNPDSTQRTPYATYKTKITALLLREWKLAGGSEFLSNVALVEIAWGGGINIKAGLHATRLVTAPAANCAFKKVDDLCIHATGIAD